MALIQRQSASAFLFGRALHAIEHTVRASQELRLPYLEAKKETNLNYRLAKPIAVVAQSVRGFRRGSSSSQLHDDSIAKWQKFPS